MRAVNIICAADRLISDMNSRSGSMALYIVYRPFGRYAHLDAPWAEAVWPD
ncbi:hypothetical protein [Anditalea andensis]|uniref:hypothetical protein n=1 Tax=Anditalea andensis TaxID=1048983 RepID=UPI0013DEEDA3|nr:hypothetical protein [Anditalea andensis]